MLGRLKSKGLDGFRAWGSLGWGLEAYMALGFPVQGVGLKIQDLDICLQNTYSNELEPHNNVQTGYEYGYFGSSGRV